MTRIGGRTVLRCAQVWCRRRGRRDLYCEISGRHAASRRETTRSLDRDAAQLSTPSPTRRSRLLASAKATCVCNQEKATRRSAYEASSTSRLRPPSRRVSSASLRDGCSACEPTSIVRCPTNEKSAQQSRVEVAGPASGARISRRRPLGGLHRPLPRLDQPVPASDGRGVLAAESRLRQPHALVILRRPCAGSSTATASTPSTRPPARAAGCNQIC